ncbi:hypothetical protein PCANC_13778 [Puccinia coronata f. sp. avenae]|uniref:Uncharacterized protein n=1 Tax=Puccinia coronata f. sp. avenae TaxID=200324 RepID=A0A2N5V2C5_9BASI|nr:hypothetical protein PCANC_13778 [Puccinia coronata f. sp. avenae]
MRSGQLANGPATPGPNAPSLAHLSPTKLQEAISDIWSQDLKPNVPIPPSNYESANDELSTTKEGTTALSTTNKGTVVHKAFQGFPAVIDKPLVIDHKDERPADGPTAVIDKPLVIDHKDERPADGPIAPAGGPPLVEDQPTAIEEATLARGIADAPLVNQTDEPVDSHPLAAPSPLEPNTGGKPEFVLPVNEPAPPVQAHNNRREQAIWDQLTFLACTHGHAPNPRDNIETADFEGFLSDCHIPKSDQYTRSILQHNGITHWSYFRSSKEADLITNLGLSTGVARFLCVGASMHRCF